MLNSTPLRLHPRSCRQEIRTVSNRPPRPHSVTQLPPDSLAQALLLAAQSVTSVIQGRNLTEALAGARSDLPSIRAQVQDIAYGTLRRYGWGDFILGRLLARPLPDPLVHALLLAALYRLESRPDQSHTVVDQAVAAVATIAGGRFKGVANGVLRNYLRQREQLLTAANTDPVARDWHPAWWLRRLQAAYPADWQRIAAAGNGQPPMTLRANTRRQSREVYAHALAEAGIGAVPVGASGLLLEKPVGVEQLPGFFEGRVSVQDYGAQRAAELLDLADGLRVLDACSAPGGKAAHILELAQVQLLALDADAKRCQRVEENLARLSLAATVKTADARRPEDWWDGRSFDRILADVPCSAAGVVRRHPDSKWLRRESDIAQFATVQRQILEALWPCLAAGGKLLYATCSVFPEENRLQVAKFLKRHTDAQRLPIAGAEDLQLLPQDDHDGFYYALLQKRA